MNSIERRVKSQQQKQWLWIVSTTLILITISGYKLYVHGLPYLAEKIAATIPAPVYTAVDKRTLESLDDAEFEPSQLDTIKQQTLRTLFASLNNHSESERQFKLEFRRWNGKANAMALADGTIVITDAMVDLANEPEELSAVLLHELGHVEHNHVMESIVSSSLVVAGLTLTIGDISTLSDIILQGAVVGINQSYSRQAELEADHYASQKLVTRYGQAQAMECILAKLAEAYPNEVSWLSTHPSFEERIAKIDSK
ncbi:M48 family metallopeptidase [Pseudoalteromonas sp. SMS1]|uniref:M48 family metallopeptidase n=1 Tax=Pseudoalteromonas sp. SMS1 TaxID=2908894 RepID=UPI001F1ED4FC|nr:M48 family metallopeptidase [Pseudoalteromonas sp. SMS1]MCF2859127.1 M48 family metallopeptidase [Pseudoalteromonas sp. SMS1]